MKNLKPLLFVFTVIGLMVALFTEIDLFTIAGGISTAFALPVCPTGCTSDLPPTENDECNPETHGAQIGKLYFTNIGNPLIDWTSAVEWNSRLSDNGILPNDIRTLHVVGSKPVPASDEKEISLGRKVTGKKTHIVNYKVDETNDTNHEFLRKNECGGNYLFWYETVEGLLFGGNEGIEASMLMDMDIPEALTDLITFQGKLEWKAKFTEERIASPI